MCKNHGGKILDQDQISLRKNSDGSFSADAWGYSLNTCNAIIAGTLNLKKDNDPLLIRQSQTKTVKLLFERALELFGEKIPTNITKRIFRCISELTRAVPGYELQFRKDQDFRKLLCEEFDL